MTSIFDDAGKHVACTVIEAGPCIVTQVKTTENDGYSALQIGFGTKKEKNVSKAQKKHFEKAGSPAKRDVMEMRDFDLDKKPGDSITVDIFAEGEKINVVGTSKGRGFQGVVKRHGFSGVGGLTHGQHDRERAPGSLIEGDCKRRCIGLVYA